MFIKSESEKKFFYYEKKTDIKKFEKKIDFKISKNQILLNFRNGIRLFAKISKFIKKNSGGLLLIDYGYTDKKMKILFKQSQIINLPIF